MINKEELQQKYDLETVEKFKSSFMGRDTEPKYEIKCYKSYYKMFEAILMSTVTSQA